jgi:dTDP-4-amino-4,6-dideoxygalactose transaminase
LAERIQAVIARVCASQHFILGPAVKELEASLATYSQCRFAVGVSSGTDALLLALMALGIGAGDAVITSSFTFFATAGTIARTGATPLFCDIDPVTFNLSPKAVQDFIQKKCTYEYDKEGNWLTKDLYHYNADGKSINMQFKRKITY